MSFSLQRTFFWCCLLSLRSTSYSISLVLTIEAYDEECFLIRPPQDDIPRVLAGSYELISDESLSAEPLLVYIQDASTDNLVFESNNQVRESFEIQLQSKRYWICIQNSKFGPNHVGEEPEHQDGLTRQVGLHYRVVTSLDNSSSEGEALVVTKSREWRDQSRRLEQTMTELVNHHDYIKVREANHRIVTEKTFNAVLLWTVLEAMVVVGVAAGQVLYFRRYLEKKQGLL